MKAFAKYLACGLAACIPLWADASSSHKPLTPQCLRDAAEAQQIHPDIMFAILMVEGGTVGSNSAPNQNGTYDIGLFQINSMHRRTIESMGVTEDMLRNDGCINAAVAAWHLRKVLPLDKEAQITTDDEYLRAIATYHSATPRYNRIYADKLRKAFEYMYQEAPQ